MRGPGWLGAQLERLTFLLDVQEAFHRPLAWGFIVLICRPYPLHQLLHFLLGAHKVVSCLCRKCRIGFIIASTEEVLCICISSTISHLKKSPYSAYIKEQTETNKRKTSNI